MSAAAADEEEEEEEGRGRRRICPSNRHSPVERRMASSTSVAVAAALKISCYTVAVAANPGFQFSDDDDGAAAVAAGFQGLQQRACGLMHTWTDSRYSEIQKTCKKIPLSNIHIHEESIITLIRYSAYNLTGKAR